MSSGHSHRGETTEPASSMTAAKAPVGSLLGIKLWRQRPTMPESRTPAPEAATPPVETASAPSDSPTPLPEAVPPPIELASAPSRPAPDRETPVAKPEEPRHQPLTPSDIVAYWRQLKNGRQLPSWSDLDSKLIANNWPNSLLLSCGVDTEHLTPESIFTEALRVASRNGAGDRSESIEFTPMLTDWILSLGRAAERFGRPMHDTDALPSASGEIRYRVIALPLSDDQERIDHVLCHVDRA